MWHYCDQAIEEQEPIEPAEHSGNPASPDLSAVHTKTQTHRAPDWLGPRVFRSLDDEQQIRCMCRMYPDRVMCLWRHFWTSHDADKGAVCVCVCNSRCRCFCVCVGWIQACYWAHTHLQSCRTHLDVYFRPFSTTMLRHRERTHVPLAHQASLSGLNNENH